MVLSRKTSSPRPVPAQLEPPGSVLAEQQRHGRMLLVADSLVALVLEDNSAAILKANNSEIDSAAQLFAKALRQLTSLLASPLLRFCEDIADTGNDGGSILYRLGFDVGINCYQSFVDVKATCSTNMTEISIVASSLLYNMGQIRLRQGLDISAKQYFIKSLRFSKQNKLSLALAVEALHNIGCIHFHRGETEKAIESFNQAFSECQKLSNSDNGSSFSQSLLHFTLNALGVLYFRLVPEEDREYALSFLTSALATNGTLSKEPHHTIATTLNNVGMIHFAEGRYKEAHDFFSRALVMRRQLFGADHRDVASTIYNIGRTLHQTGRLEEALLRYQEFLRIMVFEAEHFLSEIVDAFTVMTDCFHQLGRKDQASDLRKEIERSREEGARKMYAGIASFFCKTGKMYYDLGDYHAAMNSYSQGLHFGFSVENQNLENVTVVISNMGQICSEVGDFPSALRCFEEVLSIQLKNLGPCDVRVATTLSSMGQVHYQAMQYNDALFLHRKALQIRMSNPGDGCLEVASSLNAIGQVLFNCGENMNALDKFLESVEIRRARLGGEHHDVAVVLYNIATVLLEVGRDDEALSYYKETLRIERLALGPMHMDVALVLRYLGELYQARGELREALDCFAGALDITRHHFQQDDMRAAQILTVIANLHLHLGQTTDAVKSISEASRIARSCGSKEEVEPPSLLFYDLAKLHPEGAAAA